MAPPHAFVGTVLADQYLMWWVAQVIAVALLIFLILRWRPSFLAGRSIGDALTSALDARSARIQDQLEAAERSRQEAARIREQAQQDIERAREEAEVIVTRAQHTGEAIGQELQERAQEEYRRIVGQAKDEIEYERRQAELALQRRAADIVVDAAREVVSQNLTPESDRRLIAQSLDGMKETT